MLKKILLILLLLVLFGTCVVAGGATWAYLYFTRDLPNIASVDDYNPPAVSSIYSNDGTLVAEFYEEKRYPVKLTEVPILVRQAFLAAEDANFYNHQGIDPISILRAVVKNFMAGSTKQGASTITQQVVKNLLLTPERNLQRKVKEAILSYRIEKRLSKDEILEIYLNQIFLGNNAYGIKAAAKAYFRKELSEITLGEAAMIAGLPQAPSRYSPFLHFDKAKRRQKYVLGQMVRAGFITPQQAEDAERERIKVYPSDNQNIYHAPYYISEVRKILGEKWRDINFDREGLQVYTALDLSAEKFAADSLRKGLKEVDKRRGWRGPLSFIEGASVEKFKKTYGAQIPQNLVPGVVYPALVTEVSKTQGTAKVDLGIFSETISLKDAGWAKKKLARDDSISWLRVEDLAHVGDVIEVSEEIVSPSAKKEDAMPKPRLIFDQTPEIEGALVLLDPDSGKVLTAQGGYSYQRSVFNRATQALRQPGSTFKPVVYLSALDGFKYTPSTIVYDTPRTFRVGDEFWTPGNFDKSYLGGITLRTALEKSRNLVSADIVSRIGVDAVIRYAKKLGITSPLGRNLSLALGSSEVTVLEMTRAYGVFAAKGVLFDSVFVTKIVDRDGNVIYDYEADKLNHAQQVLNENSAFIMANLMKGVVEHGTGYRIRPIGRPVAGKTGTSNEQMDAWFIGYTPHWVCGVWAGFDQKKEIGEKETGGVVSAPIWLYFMTDFLNYQDKINYEKLVEEAKSEAERLGVEYQSPDPIQPLDFSVPDGVDPFWVDKNTGSLSEAGRPGAFYEYFIKGTEPGKGQGGESTSKSYLESPDL